MTHFNWNIEYLKKYSSLGEHSDIVYAVGYDCTGINTSGILTTTYSKPVVVGLSTENLENPIAYADLTKDVVISWLSDIKSTVETKVEGNINGNDETYIQNFPWDW